MRLHVDDLSKEYLTNKDYVINLMKGWLGTGAQK